MVAYSDGFLVNLARSGRSFMVPPGKTILDVLLENGVDVSYSCRAGACGICEVAVLSGVPDHRDEVLSPEEKASGLKMMICCSRAKAGPLLLDL